MYYPGPLVNDLDKQINEALLKDASIDNAIQVVAVNNRFSLKN